MSVQMHMHKLEHPHLCAAFRDTMIQFENPCNIHIQPHAALPTPISAPRCTEAESRMEQSRVRWQWHPSHAMNNQWTPSGAYNRGAQLQSLTPECLSLCPPLCFTFSPSHSPVPSPSLSHFSHMLVPLRSRCLTFSHHLSIFSLNLHLYALLCPTTTPYAPPVASMTGWSWYPSF